LRNMIESLPEERRRSIQTRLADSHARLQQHGLLDRLMDLAESDRPLSDADMEPINHEYYALRMACPFLENETCSIYEYRPSACRELLVTSAPELCQDLARNPVQPLPVSIRMSTALALLWAELTGTGERLIPLPIALDWANRHMDDNTARYTGMALLEQAFDKIGRFLSHEFDVRRSKSEVDGSSFQLRASNSSHLLPENNKEEK
ncbi:MAG TPA: YkgJ family cysteine cluster protein, partial [Nitrospiraceae bacterium]|nr:YkgJ family cysteine cluster protein [Nitrospiraceae bacterium]